MKAGHSFWYPLCLFASSYLWLWISWQRGHLSLCLLSLSRRKQQIRCLPQPKRSVYFFLMCTFCFILNSTDTLFTLRGDGWSSENRKTRKDESNKLLLYYVIGMLIVTYIGEYYSSSFMYLCVFFIRNKSEQHFGQRKLQKKTYMSTLPNVICFFFFCYLYVCFYVLKQRSVDSGQNSSFLFVIPVPILTKLHNA